MVASLESTAAVQCDCCGPPHANVRCMLGLIKPEMRAGRLSRMCARKLLRNTIRACPLAGADTACRVCNADLDCAAGEFCECRLASCDKTGGVCTKRPDVCPQVVAPVCGCDGMTYPNDCERQSAGACKRHQGTCVEAGGCFDTIARVCTADSCSPEAPCKLPDQFCTPRCAAPPFAGTCLDLLNRTCATRACGNGVDCLPNETCVANCPPPPPAGKCFVTVDGACSDEPCGPDHPCRQPNEFCNPACLGSPTPCASDAECDDGNGCSIDRCVNGSCEHVCVCVGPQGSTSCCPGLASQCIKPCGADPTQACGGACPPGAACMAVPGADTCECVSPLGGPCGGTIFVPTVCAPGLICKQSHPDATGVCVEPSCGDASSCGGPCTVICADGSSVAGSCAPGPEPNLPCACTAQCNPLPTPTAGPCGTVDACGGECPVSCPDGSTVTGKCSVVVVDPPGKPGQPIGPTCLCFGDCAPEPTPTAGPCSDAASCGGPCTVICADGSSVAGSCAPGPEPNLPCACTAQCNPLPTPTAGPCGTVDACGGECPVSCPDGSTVTGKCSVVVLDPPGQLGQPIGPTCLCFGDCAPEPTPTAGPCDQSPTCSGTCPFICPDGTTTTGRCHGFPMPAGKPGSPGPRLCACLGQCGPPPTIPVLPHGTICCQCPEPAGTCFEKHWVEVTPSCPEGCTTVVDGTCDATHSCVPPTPCQADADCDDGNACTLDHCDGGACVHDCVCRGPGSPCHPGPLTKPNFARH